MRSKPLNTLLDAHWRVGRLFDIPIDLHITLLFFLFPALAMTKGWGPALALEFVVLMVVSILLHELGHALMAKRYNMRGLSIMLHGFGGFATSLGYRTPKQALAITLAGPAVTFVVGALFYFSGTHRVTDQGQLLFALGVINLWMGVLNLMPSLPFDGGQALAALLNFRHHEFKARRIVGHIGLLFTPLLILVGLYFELPYGSLMGIMGLISSYMVLAQTGGIRFGELTADRRERKEKAAYRAKKEAQSQAYLGDVYSREKERAENERLRKMFEDSAD